MAAGSVSHGRLASARPRALVRAATTRPDLVVLGGMLFATLAVLLYFGRDLLPLFDDWIFWADTPSYAPGYLLEHYNGHASPVVKVVWNLTTQITGGESFVPYYLLFVAMHLAILALFYFALAPRVGRWTALVVTLPLTLMGLAWLCYVMPISGIYQAAGPLGLLAAIVALDRETRRGDIWACVALTLMCFTAIGGVAAVAGVYAWLVWPRPTPQWRRLWIPAIPTVLFALWWLVYKPETGYEFSPINDFSLIPGYVADGMSHGIRTYTYLAQDWSVALAVGVAVLVVRQFTRPNGVDRALVAVVAAGVAFWAIVAIGRGPELRPDQFRYLYPNAVHVVMIAAFAAAMAGLRSDRRTVLTLGVIALAFFLPSANQLRASYRVEREQSVQMRAGITAVELAIERASGNPIYELREDDGWNVERYREALEDGRSFAYDTDEIPKLSERLRQTIDKTSIGVLGIKTEPADVRGQRCSAPAGPVAVPRGGSVVFENRGTTEASVRARRYADNPREIGKVPPGRAVEVAFPADKSPRDWTVGVEPDTGSLRSCP